jgi:hypothetical protein
MSITRFIKLIPSQESEYLVLKYPNAFLLLTVIAMRARRTHGHPDGLKVGECHIGDYQSCGITRQQYRTALTVLCDRGIVEIVETCRSRKKDTDTPPLSPPLFCTPPTVQTGNVQKSTKGSTTRGTLVRLLTTDVYDINAEDPNQQTNHRPTTDQPPTNHEQERTRKKKNGKKEQPPTGDGVLADKKFLREFVSLTAEENEKLLAAHGEITLNLILDKLNDYKGSSGKTYKSDYHAIHSWVLDRIKEDTKNGKSKEPTYGAEPSKAGEPKFRANKVVSFGE